LTNNLFIAIIVSEIKKREIKMSNKIEVAMVVELDAGVGTSTTEVHVLKVSRILVEAYVAGNTDALNDYADVELHTWDMAVEHASSYGIEKGENGFHGEDEEEGDAEEPFSIVHGIYVPEVHDGYRCGGGSFMEEVGIEEAYNSYTNFVKTL
jgi:hypothetical protein